MHVAEGFPHIASVAGRPEHCPMGTRYAIASDGFEVSFRIPHATCRALGWALQHDAEDDTVDLGDASAGTEKREIN